MLLVVHAFDTCGAMHEFCCVCSREWPLPFYLLCGGVMQLFCCYCLESVELLYVNRAPYKYSSLSHSIVN